MLDIPKILTECTEALDALDPAKGPHRERLEQALFALVAAEYTRRGVAHGRAADLASALRDMPRWGFTLTEAPALRQLSEADRKQRAKMVAASLLSSDVRDSPAVATVAQALLTVVATRQ